jgi:hypothetical protein
MPIGFRCLVLWALLPCLAFLGSGISSARATTATIANGQARTGTITGDGVDSYSFNADAGSALVVSLSETGTHDARFAPQLDLMRPDGGFGPTHGQQLYTRVEQDAAAAGPWTVNVTRTGGGQSGGGYALKLIQIPGATGTAMTAGQTYSGSITRGGVDVYTFIGTAGRTATVTLTKTGDNGFLPEMTAFSPKGAAVAGCSGPDNCTQDFAISTAGTWTVLVWKDDPNDITGTYNVSVSGN